MNYTLKTHSEHDETKGATLRAVRKMLPFLADEKRTLALAFVAILINSVLTLIAPFMVGYAVDQYVVPKDFSGVVRYSLLILAVFVASLAVNYFQIRLMGQVGQRVLFKLRNLIFQKLQDLPVAFFNQNKTGDLISRINNDTEKLNQFFSQTLTQFVGSGVVVVGAGIALLFIHIELGGATLSPVALLILVTIALSAWVKGSNAKSMQATGSLSAEIQESLSNFKVVVAFNRRDYFRKKFEEINQQNYKTAIVAGLANNVFSPLYDLAANFGQMVVLGYGIFLIAQGNFTIGLLVSFLTYADRFYSPLRHMAMLWSSFQVALAAWDRISDILSLESNLKVLAAKGVTESKNQVLLEFKDVSFKYSEGREVLHHVSFKLEKGKTYALVGPTGGGKTTTASLIARLYDPTSGQVLLSGRDIRTYSSEERTKKIGFILQEPFLFTGTVKDNIVAGNPDFASLTSEQIAERLTQANLEKLLTRFEKGLDTQVSTTGDSVSLGQRQLIAFMRAMLRNPELLILDEATANIDTVTEQLLEEILKKLPEDTTKVIIAHRLNTIEAADQIFFVNSGEITEAGSFDHAVEMLLKKERKS